ncbi:thiolase [Mycolicibacterium novocastrense]|nr:thiolase [Mycolicibacterium novocastrense]KUH71368.1 thiolase [Mycolicibacterium novocastrense]KUH74432.1 thiolase [Mycolicibacterium novocastrense]
MSWLVGSGVTRYGRHQGRDTLDLMSEAAQSALADAGLERNEVDAVLCGYSTTLPHLMLATVFSERFGIRPRYAQAMQMGGATGLGLLMLAHILALAGAARRILVVAGENRLTGQSRDSVVQALAQVGHPQYEVPLGASVPAYYGLVASRYMHEHRCTERDFAALAVLMRMHAARHEGAQFREPITEEEVLASRPIATPLKLLDCCATADGASAFVVSAERVGRHAVQVAGVAQHHNAQHVSAIENIALVGAGRCCARALESAGRTLQDVEYAGIYDSFTVTLAMLLEEIGLAPRARSGILAREGHFSRTGPMPLNLHGGLLSYGHCGVAGVMAHVTEAHRQMTGRAGERQAPRTGVSLLHADGGVLTSHVSVVLERP